MPPELRGPPLAVLVVLPGIDQRTHTRQDLLPDFAGIGPLAARFELLRLLPELWQG